MFTRIWKGWLDGYLKAWRMNARQYFFGNLCFNLPVMVLAAVITGLISRANGWDIRGLYLFVAGICLHGVVLVPLMGKLASWWNRSGPDRRRPMHALWERFKRSGLANWWLEGMVRLIAWTIRHGVLTWTALSLSFVAYIVVLDRASEAGLATFMCSAPFFLVIGIPLVSRALSGFWERISKMHHLYSCG